MSAVKEVSKREWRGSSLNMGIITHEESDGRLSACLEVNMRVRVKLEGANMATQKLTAKSVAHAIRDGFNELPAVDRPVVKMERHLL